MRVTIRREGKGYIGIIERESILLSVSNQNLEDVLEEIHFLATSLKDLLGGKAEEELVFELFLGGAEESPAEESPEESLEAFLRA